MFFYYAGVSMVLQYKKKTVLLLKAYNNINTIIIFIIGRQDGERKENQEDVLQAVQEAHHPKGHAVQGR